MATYPNAQAALLSLGAAILDHGEDRPARDGHPTKELSMVNFSLKHPGNRYLTNPERKASLAAQIVETAWVLSGKEDIATLLPYLPRAKDFSDDGHTWRGAYGARIRSWFDEDQLANVISMLRADPHTRRAVIGIFDPAIDQRSGLKDVPCNDTLHFIKQNGALCLHVFTRSNDLVWGWSGVNQFEWSVLLEYVAAFTGMTPGTVTYSVSSMHVYQRHFSRVQSMLKDNQQAVVRGWHHTDTVVPAMIDLYQDEPLSELDAQLELFWEVEKGLRTDEPVFIDTITDPLLRDWAYVLQAYWQDTGMLQVAPWLFRSDLDMALRVSARRKKEEEPAAERIDYKKFLQQADELHRQKHDVYGDSWQRRGELISIVANIARKVDRLGKPGAGDTDLDTALDLMIYLAKYRLWLSQYRNHELPAPLAAAGPGEIVEYENLTTGESHPDYVAAVLELWATADFPTADSTDDQLEALAENAADDIRRLFDALDNELQDEELHPGEPLLTDFSQLGGAATALAGSIWLQQRRREAARMQWHINNATRNWKGYDIDDDSAR